MNRALVLILTFCLFSFSASAAVFTVTSKGDTGPGTLYDAVSKSNDNGNDEVDYIYFNLPGTTTADRTITIYTLLPAIKSDLVIDASTQPGAPLSVNGARVVIAGVPPYEIPVTSIGPIGFQSNDPNVYRFEMYGLVIREFYRIKAGDSYNGGYGVYCTVQNVVIGAPGKGNVLYNNGVNLYAQGGLLIRSNLVGLKEDGISFGDGFSGAITAGALSAGALGGDNQADANYAFGPCSIGSTVNNGQFIVKNNVFNANSVYERSPAAEALLVNNDITISIGANGNNNGQPDLLVSQNVFGGKVVGNSLTQGFLQLTKNYFGRSPDGIKNIPIPREALHFTSITGHIMIGGNDGEGNVLTNAVSSDLGKSRGDAVVETENSPNGNIELSHNSFYCNNGASPYTFIFLKYNEKPLYVTVDNLSTSHADGVTSPNSKVELFYTDKECTACQPKRYITTVNADQAGKWKYDAALETGYGVMASATLNHRTSEFTDTRFYYDNFVIDDIACGNTGNIRGLIVFNYKTLEWVDEHNNVVSHELVLKDVPEGKYRLRAEQFGCVAYTPPFSVSDISAKVDASKRVIKSTLCNGYNGSVTGLKVLNATSYQWINDHGDIVGNQPDLQNVKAGSYTLMMNNGKCVTPYGPVVVPAAAQSDIKIMKGTESIAQDQCGQQVGSITNISVSGGTLPYQYAWADANGHVVSNSANADHLAAGKYTLRVTDATNCGLATADFTIVNQTGALTLPLVNDMQVCSYDALVIVRNVEPGTGYRLYQSAYDAIPIADSKTGKLPLSLKQSHTYFVTSYVGGCESERVPVNVTIDPHALRLSNTFSPNNDGINDVWNISGIEYYPHASVQVFARNGRTVFDSKQRGGLFDGKFEGRLLPAGVYYYVVDPGMGCGLLSGYLTILK